MKIDTSGKVAYWCKTKEDSDAFLEECNKLGIIRCWCDEKASTHYLNEYLTKNWNEYREETCYDVNGGAYLTYAERECYEADGYAIIEYKKENKMDIKEFVKQLDKDGIAELKAEIEKREKLPKNVIAKGEMYCFMQIDGVVEGFINNGSYDKSVNKYTPVFRTKSDAEEWAKAMAMRTEYERWCGEYPVDWDDEEQEKHYAYYDSQCKHLDIEFVCVTQIQGTIYCANADHIQAYIKKVGEPNYKKYILGIDLPKRCWLEV